MNAINRFMTFISQFVTPIYVLRAPIIAVLFCSTLLAFPDQALEIMRALALDRARYWPQIVLAFATLFAAGVFIWFLGRALTYRGCRRRSPSARSRAASPAGCRAFLARHPCWRLLSASGRPASC